MPNSLQSLLDRDPPSDYRWESTAHVAMDVNTVVATTESAVVFRLHSEWLALSTMVLHGIGPAGTVHTLPHRRNGVLLGVTPMRGELLICVSLGALLGVATVPGAAGQHAGRDEGKKDGAGRQRMIVKGAGGLLVFPVDEVYGVHRYRGEDLREVPATLAHAETRYTAGMLPWHDRWVARLDDALIFHAIAKVLS
ncbi:MAG TPA: chemotaxis protein CheW [Gemmatimonadaceae bacterium]|jgi:chemotaxis-related protein WspD|nr:chemotaxis protein CheW [Gemmatimonadaceae bacterium]